MFQATDLRKKLISILYQQRTHLKITTTTEDSIIDYRFTVKYLIQKLLEQKFINALVFCSLSILKSPKKGEGW